MFLPHEAKALLEVICL